MAWPRVKNIVILILLLTNVCLLFFVGGRQARERQLQAQARGDVLAFLAERGIQVDEALVPQVMALTPQRVERDLEGESALATALLGEGVTIEVRGGGIYRYNKSGAGTLQCHSSGEFWGAFFQGAFPVGEEGMEEHALATMKLIQFEGEVLSQSGDAQEGRVTLRQLWNGAPLLPCQATLVYENGCLTGIEEGRRLMGQPEPAPGVLVSPTTALMDFYTGLSQLGDVCSKISAITQAYTLSSAIGGPLPMIPVWQITTDTGAYELNMMTGELVRSGGAAGTQAATTSADALGGG